jgi:hypothetical protein
MFSQTIAIENSRTMPRAQGFQTFYFIYEKTQSDRQDNPKDQTQPSGVGENPDERVKDGPGKTRQ